MSNLIDRDELYEAMAKWDWQDLYLPVHFKELVDEMPVKTSLYTEREVKKAYNDGVTAGCVNGYENAVRTYAKLALRQWTMNEDRKPDKPGQYLCTLWDANGTYLAIVDWNDTFGGRWQCVFEGEDSYSDIGNVLAWMPLPPAYGEEGDVNG